MKTILLILFITISYANQINLTKEEKEFIKTHPIINIDVTNDKPFSYKLNNNDKPQGFMIDLLAQLSLSTGLKFNISINPWIENYNKLIQNKATIISDVFYKKSREKKMLFSKPYVKLPLVLFSNKNIKFNSFNELKSSKVGVIEESPAVEFLKKYKNINLIIFKNQNEQIKNLALNKIDYAIQTMQTANVYIRKNKLTNIYPIKIFDDIELSEHFSFAINKSEKILLQIINKAIDSVELDLLVEKWFTMSNENYKLTLTKNEKEFIKKHPTIYLGTEKSWEPYVINRGDAIDGYDSEILNKINKLTGANFVLKLGKWQEMQEKAKNKEIDGLSTGAIHDERKLYLNFSNIYISLQKMVMVKHRNPLHIKNKQDLAGRVIAIHKSNLVDEKIAKEFPNSTILRLDSVEDVIRELVYGKADAIFGNGATEYIANKMGLPYVDFAFPLEHRLELAFGVRKDWPEAISIINKALDSISEHELNKIKQKWFLLSDYEKQIKRQIPKITLTVNEKLYLKNNTIKMCIDPDWYPFEFIDENGEYNGLISDLFKKVESNLNAKVTVIKTKEWKESLDFLKNRKCDITASAQKTKKRSKYLNFTKPYVTSPLVIATNEHRNFIDDFQKVKDKTFAIVKGYASIEVIKEIYPNIKIIEVDNIKDGLIQVAKNRVFGFIDTVPTIVASIKKNALYNIKINGKVDIEWKLSIASRNDIPILNDIFNKGVKSLSNKEVEAAMDKWIKVNSIKEPDYMIYWQILSVLILIIVSIFYWNIKLKEKVKEALIKHKKQESLLFHYYKQRSLGELIGNISHQWRHPISEISGNLMNLEAKQKIGIRISDSDIKKHIKESKRLINFMSETVDTFYNFYSKESEKKEFNIANTIKETLLILKGSFELEQIHVETLLDNNINIKANANELKQVLLSILLNSKKIFIQRSIDNPNIIIKLYETYNVINLDIIDNAGGIDSNLITKLFEFPISQTGGTGLGLYLAKTIIEDSYNGNISMENFEDGIKTKIMLPCF
jgi:polar amino acid transport system substrate-binding protein